MEETASRALDLRDMAADDYERAVRQARLLYGRIYDTI